MVGSQGHGGITPEAEVVNYSACEYPSQFKIFNIDTQEIKRFWPFYRICTVSSEFPGG
jgi:hypothetical protein